MRPSVVPDNNLSNSRPQEAVFTRSDHHPEADLRGKVGTVKLLPLREVAEILDCTYETARQLAKRGELTYVQRPGCSIRVPETALSEYLERHTCHAQENCPDLSASTVETTGTSAMDAKSVARAIRMRRKQNVS